MSMTAYPQNQIAMNPYAGQYYGGYPTAVNPYQNYAPSQNVPAQNVPNMQAQQVQQAQNVPPQSPAPSGFPTIDGVSWVQGEGAAKAVFVAAGKTVMLIDSESDRFYLKSADAYGRPQPLQAFRYTVDEPAPEASTADFVTRQEFDQLRHELERLNAANNEKYEEPEDNE